MPDSEKLITEFITSWNAGLNPDPTTFLERAGSDAARADLARDLELFIEIAPTPDYSENRVIEAQTMPEARVAAEAFDRALAARRLSEAREAQGMTLRDLAKRLLAVARIEPKPESLDRAEAHLVRAECGDEDFGGWSRRARSALADILSLEIAPTPSPSVLMLRRSAETDESDYLGTIEFVTDALDLVDQSPNETEESAADVDEFIFDEGSTR